MARLSFGQAFDGIRRVFLDSAPIIYAIENDPEFGPITWRVIEHCLAIEARFVTSPITLAECLAGTADPSLMHSFVEFLTGTEVEFEGLTDIDALQAGVMRRSTNLPLPDCLQIACAIRSRCDLLLTNDVSMRSNQTAIRVLCLTDLDPTI